MMIAHVNNTAGSQESDNEIYPDEYQWLGIVYSDDVRPERALITPLAYYNDNRWNPISYQSALYFFPNNGKVAIFAKDFPVSKTGYLCYFWPERNTHIKDENEPRYSHYLVKGELKLSSITQFFDWTNRARETLELPALLEQGIVPTECFTQRIYIRHHQYVYGPIKLDRSGEWLKPHEYVQSNSNGGPSLLVSIYAIRQEEVLTLNDRKHEFNVFIESLLGTPVGQEDWSLPQVVVKRVLQASKSASNVVNDVQLVDNDIRKLARLSSQDGPSALHIEEATLKRAQYIINNQKERLTDIQKLIENLLADHPLITATYEQVAKLRRASLQQEADETIQVQKKQSQQLEGQIQELQAKLDIVYQDIHTAEGTLKVLYEDIHTAETKLKALQDAASTAIEAAERAEKEREQARELEHEIQKRIEQLREKPLQILADLHIAASLLPGSKSSSLLTDDAYHLPHATSPIQAGRKTPLPGEHSIQWVPNRGKMIHSNTLQDLMGILNVPFARLHDINSETLKLCASALLAGCIPSISGFASASLLRAIAHVIANERMWSVPVPLTALSPLDLFGKVDAEKRMFIPTAGNLADIILQAKQNPQELAIVLLEGIDRAPTMPIAVPLLRQYIQLRHNNTKPAPLSLFHPLAITPDDPYQKLAQFTWPNNILLAVTVDDDSGSFQLPEMLEHWLTHINVLPKKTPPVQQANPPAPSFVSFSTWQGWIETIRKKAEKNSQGERIIEQRMLYEILTTLKSEKLDPDEVINEMWPSLEDDVDR